MERVAVCELRSHYKVESSVFADRLSVKFEKTRKSKTRHYRGKIWYSRIQLGPRYAPQIATRPGENQDADLNRSPEKEPGRRLSSCCQSLEEAGGECRFWGSLTGSLTRLKVLNPYSQNAALEQCKHHFPNFWTWSLSSIIFKNCISDFSEQTNMLIIKQNAHALHSW